MANGPFFHSRKVIRKVYYLILVGLLAVLAIGWWLGSVHNLSIPGSQAIAIGRLFGLLSAFSILLEILLISRAPFIEKNFDLDEASDLHRLNGYFVLFAILAHLIFLVFGYANPISAGLWSQFTQLNSGLPQVLNATIGTIIFFAMVALSIRIARKKLPYELWYFTHLALYAAIILTFAHQVLNGGDFITQPWFKIFWIGLYGVVFGLLLIYRVARPLYYLKKYSFKVDKIVAEANGIHSIYITGRHINKFRFIPGQYARWRFLAKGVWLESHPYSFSGPPSQDYLRLTIKSDAQYGQKISHFKPGTKVLIDGPRGAFTPITNPAKQILLIGGGIGVAPYLSAIGQLLADKRRVSLYYAAHDHQCCAFKSELNALQKMGLELKYYVSSDNNRIDQTVLQACVNPETAIYICGPDKMSKDFETKLLKCGQSKSKLIIERFAW